VLTRGVIALALAMTPLAARAQSPPQTTWRATAGYETFSFRDVSSSRPPVDGSPVRWQGTGIGTVPRPSSDGASFVEGQYDYRRYLARELGVGGLHAGIGVRGAGERRVLEHHYGGDVTLTETDVRASIAIVAALRFRPNDRFSAEAEWSNAAALLHGRQLRVADVSFEKTGWGGGWTTDLAARGEVRVAAHVAAVIFYLRRGEGLLFDLRSYTAERHRVMAGITYAR
jgi:hypothetical protein